MKPILEVKRQSIAYHTSNPFLGSLLKASAVHGYKGFAGPLRFLWVRTKDHWLQVLSRVMPYNGIRIAMQKMRGVNFGKDVYFGPMITIDDTYPYFVSIGDGAGISGQCYLLAHTIPWKYFEKAVESFVAPVVIEKRAWLAIGVIVLPGVTIGEGAIIGAGSVVTKSIPPFVFATGSPAQVKKDIAEKLKHNYSEEEYQNVLNKRKVEFGF